jgi:hypothetical protein
MAKKKKNHRVHLDDFGRELDFEENHEENDHPFGTDHHGEPEEFRFGPFTKPLGIVPLDYQIPPEEDLRRASYLLNDPDGYEEPDEEFKALITDAFVKTIEDDWHIRPTRSKAKIKE